MSQNPPAQPPGLQLRKSEGGPSTPRDRHSQTPKPPGIAANGTGQSRGGAEGSGEVGSLQREIRESKKQPGKEKAEKKESKWERGKPGVEGKAKDEEIKKLEHEIRGMRESAEREAKRIQVMEEQLKQTQELLATRTAELSGTHTFLSTKDRLPEAEVLGFVRDLNENIFQVAVKLTEGWEKLGPPRATSKKDADPNSRPPRVPALVRLVRNRDPASLTFLLQTRLCSQATGMTSSWRRHREGAVLESIYQRLSTSGEGRIVDTKYNTTHAAQRDRRSQPDGGR